MQEYYTGVVEVLNSPSVLPKDRRERFEYNVALAIKYHAKTGQHVIPIRPLCGTPLEAWEGSSKILRSFLAHIFQDPVPGVGRQILSGSRMPDGSLVGGAPSVATIVPTPPSPKKIAAAIAKAKAAIAKGAKRDAVLKRLRSAGIETSEV
jgi:hypothetical protein